MPEEIKLEQYSNMGGINRKISQYVTGNQFMLDIINMDFRNPGALTKRPGSTQFIASGASFGFITGLYDFQRLNGLSMQLFTSGSKAYLINNGATPVEFQGGMSPGLMNFVSFVDRAFFCNGSNFMKFSGQTSIIGSSVFATNPFPIWTSYLYSLPPTSGASIGALQSYNSTIGSSGVATGMTGYFTYVLCWANDRGFVGPAPASTASGVYSPNGPVVSAAGATQITIFPAAGNWPIPASYGIGFTSLQSYNGFTITALSAVAVYRSNFFASSSLVTGPYYRVGFITVDQGGTYLFGGFNDTNLPLGITTLPTCISPTLAPRFLEIFNNQMFMGGFSAAPSTAQFSDIGEPESVQPNYNFEVRTNDGDRLSGYKNYLGQLFMFKERSFHALSGDNPANFALRQISDQYGALSHRAIATFEDKMVFLDQKGIALYNGAQPVIISNQIDDIFRTMNVDAAKDQACMVHNRPQNQVWCAFPINGSTFNNMTVVYDYLAQAWSTYKGFNPQVMTMVKTGFSEQTVMYGSYSGLIYNFGTSLMGDNGAGITCQLLTKFNSEQESVQKLFRRLWTNVTPNTSATSTVNIDFYKDYNSTTSITTQSIGLTQFQTRLDFGISARSLAIKYTHFSSTDPFVLQGFALGHRFLRNT